jgi:two-component SAPR family response regulator
MCLEKFCRTVRAQVLDFGTYLWEEEDSSVAKATRVKLETRYADLAAEVGRRQSLTARYQAELVELRRRLVDHEKRASFLLKRIEIFHRVGDQAKAWSHALQLEQVRVVIRHERSRLKDQESVFREHRARTDRLREKLADLDAPAAI